jgi:hypothetical protein
VVDIAGLRRSSENGRLGDFVKHHPAHRYRRLERLHQVPGDRLALAVFIRRQVQLVGALERVAQLCDGSALVRGDDVQRLEGMIDIHTQPCPGFALVLGRHIGSAAG